ncbi:MAG: bifunctional DNA-formamidopyrimidine glycosylase/DNA-(apurinic or apyrimidinic site) lyase [Alphaproteobacteria bacterium]|nr:bifunctional DNA-formamidopyrimidine glycosylase/DNA-(apurinic or apyrimidinic site) lyase [Alphaproteobacteria bacterium]
MPELPEVETIKQNLELLIIGKIVAEVVLRRPDLRIPIPKALPQVLKEHQVIAVERRAKYLLLTFDHNRVVILHLGMSGRIRFERTLKKDFQTHDHVVFIFTDGSAIVFNDPRRFGLIELTAVDVLGQHPLFKHLGPEPLHLDFTGELLFDTIHQRHKAIKLALMDNQVVVGVGNIYASESLYQAGIHPLRPCSSLTKDECEALVACIKQVLVRAIDAGGSTLKDYSQVSGESGYFQHQFLVYGRDKEPCQQCNHIIEKEVIGGRSSFFCVICQPVNR